MINYEFQDHIKEQNVYGSEILWFEKHVFNVVVLVRDPDPLILNVNC